MGGEKKCLVNGNCFSGNEVYNMFNVLVCVVLL